jgi:eukaryotic-like serine/threonine-protein kinase
MSELGTPEDSLSLTDLQQVVEACTRFEDDWLAGRRPWVEDFLGQAAEPLRSALLRDLLRLDLHYRRQRGESPTTEEYRGRFPGDGPLLEALFQATPPQADKPASRTGPFAPRGPAGLGDALSPPSVPGYDTLREVGRGGMGVVYEAEHLALNRRVALKVLRAGVYADEAERRRFRAEAEAIARLAHPHIVQVHDVGEHQGLPYFCLEFCPGGSLAKHLRGTPLPPREAAALVETLARAVQAAHEAGVIHRDLKPANVLLAADGTPKLTDFGLAKRLDVPGQTPSDAILGTPEYMAPEQALGQAHAVGRAADVYALGATLYELLTGRPPFRAATAVDTILQVVADDPVPPRRLQPGCPRDLETVCLKCLEKSPRKRYASALELAEDLRRFLTGEPIQARPVGAVERAAKWVRRNRTVAGLLGAVAGVLLAGVGVSTYFAVAEAWQAEFARDEARKKGLALEEARQANELAGRRLVSETRARLEETKAKNEARTQRDLARDRLDVARRNHLTTQLLRVDSIYRPEPLRGKALLEDTAACPLDLRDFAWGLYDRWCQRERGTLAETEMVPGAAASKDGRTLAWADRDGTIRLFDARTGRHRTLRGEEGRGIFGLAFSPDGKVLAAHDGEEVRGWNVTDGTVCIRRRRGKVLNTITALAFRPDGKLFALGPPDPPGGVGREGVALWGVHTGEEHVLPTGLDNPLVFTADGKLLLGNRDGTLTSWQPGKGGRVFARGHAGPVEALATSADGKLLASAGSDGTARVWEAATGKEMAVFRGHRREVLSVAFSPEGKLLVSGGSDQSLRVWDVGGEERARLHTSAVRYVTFLDGTRLLASQGGDGALRLWDTFPGQPHATLRSHAQRITSVALTPDGTTLATGSGGRDAETAWGEVKLWDPAGGPERLTLKGHADTVTCLAFSPDGRLLASGADDHVIILWDVKKARSVRTLRGHAGPVSSLAFRPGGKTLASAGHDGTVRLWDLATGAPQPRIEVKGGKVHAVAFSPDGKLLATGSEDARVRLWDVETGKEVGRLEGHAGEVLAVAFRPGGKSLAAGAGGQDNREKWFGEVKLWDVAKRQEVATLHGHASHVMAVAFSPDGHTLASGSEDATVKLYDAVTGQERLTLRGHGGGVAALAFGPDSKRLVAAGGGRQDQEFGEALVWEAARRPERAVLRGHAGAVRDVAFHPDGKRLLSVGQDRTVRVWDRTTGQQDAVLRGHTQPVRAVAVAPGGGVVATGTAAEDLRGESLPGEVVLWDGLTGRRLLALGGLRAGVRSLAFRADGKVLAALADGGEVRLWDTASKRSRPGEQ